MKTFKLDLVTFPKLKRVTIDGKRHYLREGAEESSAYPSVTTVLEPRNKQAIVEWRKRVGEKTAQAITTKASRQGTSAHGLIEDYILGKEINYKDEMPVNLDLFGRFREVADQCIDNIRSVEGQMISDFLRVAGTVDLIAEFNGKLSVIDWKTSSKPKKKEWIENYFMQEAAYAVMFEENTKIPVGNLVTIISCSTGETQVFVEKRDDWIDNFIEWRDKF